MPPGAVDGVDFEAAGDGFDSVDDRAVIAVHEAADLRVGHAELVAQGTVDGVAYPRACGVAAAAEYLGGFGSEAAGQLLRELT